jgi:hydroxymethylpyrimidine/phosphomethylpyrimidine kinase
MNTTKKTNRSLPVALTIAGSDSGGGAGIQADLKTFTSLGVHGTSVITCITAQNPRRVLGIQACRPDMVRRQLEAVVKEFHPVGIKTGMLYSAAIIRTVASFFGRGKRPQLVVDPVMVASSGARLLERSAVAALQRDLLPMATLLTPNLAEAEVLVQHKLKSLIDLRLAAKAIHRRFGCAVVVKGGHVPHAEEAADVFFDGRDEWLLSAPLVKKLKTHGTGCTFSAAVAGYLALGCDLFEAVTSAKEYISRAIDRRYTAAGHFVLSSV